MRGEFELPKAGTGHFPRTKRMHLAESDSSLDTSTLL